jgi:mono/diheme cytochrome c family protein
MSDSTKKMEAQQREMPEPWEGDRPMPWVVIILVGAVFAWAIGYIATTHWPNPPSYGDRRTAVDFQQTAAAAGGAVDGAQIYTAQCLACHQATGKGLPGVFPPLAESEWVTGKDALAVQIVLHGINGEISVGGTTYKGAMPAFKDKLDDKQIAAVLSHVRTSFGNAASKIDAATVAAQRTATASQAAPWSGGDALQAFK